MHEATMRRALALAASVRADKLPLFIHLDSDARQVTEVSVHVISERFAGLTDDTQNRVLTYMEHSSNGINRRAFAEQRQN